jgi:hypothetical protein
VDGFMRFAAYRGFLGVLELAVGITSGKFADFDPNGCSDVVVQLINISKRKDENGKFINTHFKQLFFYCTLIQLLKIDRVLRKYPTIHKLVDFSDMSLTKKNCELPKTFCTTRFIFLKKLRFPPNFHINKTIVSLQYHQKLINP